MLHKFKKGQFVKYWGLIFDEIDSYEGFKELIVDGYTNSGLVKVSDKDGEEWEIKESVLEG